VVVNRLYVWDENGFTVKSRKNAVAIVLTLLLVAAAVEGNATKTTSAEDFEQGQFALSVKNWDRAITVFTKLIKGNPKFYVAYHNRAVAYSKKGDYDKCIADLRKAVELNPKYPDAYGLMGLVYEIRGEYSAALKVYKKALELEKRPKVKKAIEGWIEDAGAKLSKKKKK